MKENNKTFHCFFEQSGTFKNEFKKLDMDAIEKLAPLYRTNNLKFLVKFIRRMK